MSFLDHFRSGWRAGAKLDEKISDTLAEYRNPIRARSATQKDALKELQTLHGEVRRLFESSPLKQSDQNEFIADLALDACQLGEKEPSMALLRPFFDTSFDLMLAEGIWEPRDIDWEAHFTLEEEVELRRYLKGQARIFSRYDELVSVWREKLLWIFSGVLGYLPDSIAQDGSVDDEEVAGLQVTLIDLLDNSAEVIERLIVTLADDDVVRSSLFVSVRERLERNLLTV